MRKVFTLTIAFTLFMAAAVLAQPVANFNYTPDPCYTAVAFTDISSGNIITWWWDFGDGSSSTQQNPYHWYSAPGTYNVSLTVMDSFQQQMDTIVQQVTVSNSGPLVTVDSWVDVGCGGQNGEIQITVTGGTPPYSYEWYLNGQTVGTTEDLTGLTQSGWYVLTVWDQTQCFDSSGVYINGPSLSISTSTDYATCGNADGSASVSVFGGFPPFTFSWSNGATDSTVTGLAAGTYMVTVMDNSGCSLTDSNVMVVDSCGAITGRIWDDANGNGVQDPGEDGLAGVEVVATPGNLQGVTNSNGDYSITVSGFGAYTVGVVIPPAQYYCSYTVLLPKTISAPVGGTYAVVLTTLNPVSSGNNFGLKPPVVPCGTVCGTVFDDANMNGTQDAGETGIAGINLQVSPGYVIQTDANGNYCIELPFDTAFDISVLISTQYYYCNGNAPSIVPSFPANGSYTITLTAGSPNAANIDFGVYYSQLPYDAGIYSVRTYYGDVPGLDFNAWMDFKIFGIQTDTCFLRLEHDPLITFISASLTPSTIAPNYVEWTILPGSNYNWYCMGMTFHLDSSAVPGSSLLWLASFDCGGVDQCPNNDTKSRVVVVGANKRGLHEPTAVMQSFSTGDDVTGEITRSDSILSYVINFQNTGTDTAYNLVIRDTLSEHLNVNRISYPFSSWPHKMSVHENVVVWELKGINLVPKDTNYAKSYGFIQYDIHIKPNLPAGTQIINSASASINYYDEMKSDVVINTIVEANSSYTDVAEDLRVAIYPNPNNGQFNLTVATAESNATIEVIDQLGRTVKRFNQTMTQQQQRVTLDLTDQPAGLYFVKVSNSTDHLINKVMLIK